MKSRCRRCILVNNLLNTTVVVVVVAHEGLGAAVFLLPDTILLRARVCKQDDDGRGFVLATNKSVNGKDDGKAFL